MIKDNSILMIFDANYLHCEFDKSLIEFITCK